VRFDFSWRIKRTKPVTGQALLIDPETSNAEPAEPHVQVTGFHSVVILKRGGSHAGLGAAQFSAFDLPSSISLLLGRQVLFFHRESSSI